jgi:hypothetical protein
VLLVGVKGRQDHDRQGRPLRNVRTGREDGTRVEIIDGDELSAWRADTTEAVAAHDVDLIVNMSHTIDPLEDACQHLPQKKRRHTAPHREYSATVFKLKAITAAAKIDMAFEFFTRSMFRIVEFSVRLCFSLWG